ncbi:MULTISPECIES: hypothetical protein [Achromobacter]|uniref:hypothetical protein n=1 Tax=Achromobacter TaxID=222 RepID=UPI0023F7C74E|nr:hypothetical protein [Achromobacter anxifer]MDF8363363.1 hypothetical protein [Achromobacter anxifer]
MSPAQQKAVHLVDEILKAAGLPTYTRIQQNLQVLDEYCELESGEAPEDLEAARHDLQHAAYTFRDADLGEVDHPEDVPAVPSSSVIEAALRRLMHGSLSAPAIPSSGSAPTAPDSDELAADALSRMTAAITQMFPEISTARCATAAKTLHADHGALDLHPGDLVTVYIAPSPSLGYVTSDQARIYAIPYMLRDGQSPRDLTAYQHQWMEIGLFVPSTQKVRCLESEFAHIADDLVGQAPGVTLVTVRAAALARRAEAQSDCDTRDECDRPRQR